MKVLSVSIGSLSTLLLAVPTLRLHAAPLPQQPQALGTCVPLQTVGIPPPSNCASTCPTGTCGQACGEVSYVNGACVGSSMECFYTTIANLPKRVCRVCVCNNDPYDPTCVWDEGPLQRLDRTATATNCHN